MRAGRLAGWRRWHFVGRIQSLSLSGGWRSLGSKLLAFMAARCLPSRSASGRAHSRIRQPDRARRCCQGPRAWRNQQGDDLDVPDVLVAPREAGFFTQVASGLQIRVLQRPPGASASGGGVGVSGGPLSLHAGRPGFLHS